jgi:hypothetical protein
MLVKFGTLPYDGGWREQHPKFVQFCFIAMASESEVNRSEIRKMKRSKK